MDGWVVKQKKPSDAIRILMQEMIMWLISFRVDDCCPLECNTIIKKSLSSFNAMFIIIISCRYIGNSNNR